MRCPQTISTLDHEGDITYKPTGSGIGIQQIYGDLPTVDFAGSDTIETIQDLIDSKGDQADDFARTLGYFPSAATAVAVIANVPLASKQSPGDGSSTMNLLPLSLTRDTLAQIFMGSISRWNDPKIKATNRNFALLLPDREILPVVRNDSSGTTAIFVRALSAFASNGDSTSSIKFESAVNISDPLLPAWPDSVSSSTGSSARTRFVRAARSSGVIKTVSSDYETSF